MLNSILAFVSILAALTLIPILWRRHPFHPTTFFLLLATVDVFFPAIYWMQHGQVDNPEWLPLLSEEKILAGLIFYSSFLFIFALSSYAVDGGKSAPLRDTALSERSRERLQAVVWILFAGTFAKMAMELVAYGGIEPWFWSKLVFASVDDPTSAAAADKPLAALPIGALFQAAVGLAFFHRKHLNRPRLFGVFFPTIAILLAMSTFLRGTVLTCAATLIFAEVMRQKIDRSAQLNPKTRSRVRPKLLVLTIAAIVSSMYIYGSIRDNFRGLANSAEDTGAPLAVPTFLTAGHGLLGVSHIVAEYGQSLEFMWGKTYFDMLLLPVPRSIYSSKPSWYGIDDITRGMGWPESTQSAVTMPGEAFANFGMAGLLVAIPLGVLFGWLQLMMRSNHVRLLLLGPVLLFQVVSVTNWMSFTGFMNAVPLLTLLFLLAAYLGRGSSKKRPLITTAGVPRNAH